MLLSILSLSMIFIYYVDSTCTSKTGSDAEGPFYTPNAPIRTNFSAMDPKAQPLFISGTIYDELTCQGIFAKIDFWSANSSGNYDNIGYNMRGSFYTDQNGYYSLSTRMPGYFAPRPEHIHVKIWRNDINVLTTQIYFADYGHGGGDVNREAVLISDEINEGYITWFDFHVYNTPDTTYIPEPHEGTDTTTIINDEINSTATVMPETSQTQPFATELYTSDSPEYVTVFSSITNSEYDATDGTKMIDIVYIVVTIIQTLLLIEL